jgi:hypothetical protein
VIQLQEGRLVAVQGAPSHAGRPGMEAPVRSEPYEVADVAPPPSSAPPAPAVPEPAAAPASADPPAQPPPHELPGGLPQVAGGR